jgi:hypothetical protein
LFQQIAECFKAGTIKGSPAKTGKDKIRSHAVINTAQTKSVNLSQVKPADLVLITVTIKFIAPSKEEIPAICKLKIDKSTAAPK